MMKSMTFKNSLRLRVAILTLLLTVGLGSASGASIPAAIYTAGNRTLTFTTVESADITSFEGYTITGMWVNNDVVDIPIGGDPGWKDLGSEVRSVRFDDSFINVRPKNLSGWFKGFKSLSDFSATLGNLNTSEATNMSYMFYDCTSLKELDLTNFDTSKVTDMTRMFENCTSLKTIYCNDIWQCDNSKDMFHACYSLQGAKKCVTGWTVAEANPNNGYFTYKNVTWYDVSICGHQINNKNCNDLTVLNEVSVTDGGKVAYDPNTKTLLLKDATIIPGVYVSDVTVINSHYVIDSDIDNLTIEVEGKNTIMENSWTDWGLYLPKATTITGGGILDIYATHGIQFGDKLTFNDVTIYAVESWYAIEGIYESNPNIVIAGKQTSVYAIGDSGSVLNVKSITYEGDVDDNCIRVPENAVLDNDSVKVDGVVVTDTVLLQSPQEKYDLKICGVQVTSWNCDDLTVIDGVTNYSNKSEELEITNNYMRYDPDTQTLHLNGIYIESEATGIESSVSNLTINVVSSSVIISNGKDAVSLSANTTITGNGSLSCLSMDKGEMVGNGIKLNMQCRSLTIDNKLLMAMGKNGIAGTMTVSRVNPTIYFSSLTVGAYSQVLALGTEGNAGIYSLSKLSLADGLKIYYDAGLDVSEAQFTNHSVRDPEGNLSRVVQIKRPEEGYDLWINEKQVTSENCREIHATEGIGIKKQNPDDDIITRYDPATKTLTLYNAQIETQTGFSIESKTEGLTMRLGQTVITNYDTQGPAVLLDADNTTITCYNDTAAIIRSEGNNGLQLGGRKNMTFDNAIILISGKKYGITGSAASDGGLNFSYLNRVEVKGSKTSLIFSGEEGSVVNLADFSLNESDGIAITLPKDAKMVGTKLCVGTEVVKGLVLIQATKIKGDVNEDRSVDISDIVTVINQIAGTATYRYADVNEDKSVDISDIVAIINIIAEN